MAETAKVIKRALVSVSDKSGLVDFCSTLVNDFAVEIISTGGTFQFLKQAKVKAIPISDFTDFPEIMGGRVKTLHPKIHAGILARRDVDEEVMKENHILPIDLVIVNLYPFEQIISNKKVKTNEAIENIDIGGPAMVRAAAKNNKFTGVVVDPKDYPSVLKEMKKNNGSLLEQTRSSLATKAFTHTANYDSVISGYLSSISEPDFPDRIFSKFQKKEVMRYGENPHQKAAFYTDYTKQHYGVGSASQLQGKQLSFNNIADADSAIECARSFDEPTCVIIKHSNPCGVATDNEISKAYQKAFEADPTSAFGGIIAFNRKLEETTAKKIIDSQFVEVLISPGISKSAQQILSSKENIRILDVLEMNKPISEFKFLSVAGGLLVQETDDKVVDLEDIQVVSSNNPSNKDLQDCLFAWKVCKFVKSNAIVYVKDKQTIGIGAGQMSRIDSLKIGASKAKETGFNVTNSVMASDAFFPFRDSVDFAASIGITAIIQPGGSIRDEEVIEAANEANISMVFTGFRHFRH